MDFEIVYADLVRLVNRYCTKDRSLQPHTLPLKIMPLILMIDDRVLPDSGQKERLLDLFHRAKLCLPSSLNENPWLDLFRLYPKFENVLLKILGEETFLELRGSFFVDEEEERVFSRSIERAHGPRRKASKGFDEHFVELEAVLKSKAALPEKGEQERQIKRNHLKGAIDSKVKTGFNNLGRLTDEQADRLVQLMIETSKIYLSLSPGTGKPFHEFCENKLKGLLEQAKLNQLVRTLSNQAKASSSSSCAQSISQINAPPAADSAAARLELRLARSRN